MDLMGSDLNLTCRLSKVLANKLDFNQRKDASLFTSYLSKSIYSHLDSCAAQCCEIHNLEQNKDHQLKLLERSFLSKVPGVGKDHQLKQLRKKIFCKGTYTRELI